MKKFLEDIEEEYDKLSRVEKEEFGNAYVQGRNSLNPVINNMLDKIYKKEEELMKPEEKKLAAQVLVETTALPSTVPVVPKAQAITTAASRGMSFQETMAIATQLYQSKYFTDVGNTAQAFAKIMAGRELGLPPMISLSKVYVIKGRTAIESEIAAGLIKKSGVYDYIILKQDSKGCTLQFTKDGKPIKDAFDGKVTFNEDDAKRAQLLGKDNYKKYPSTMYLWRAMMFGARKYCPHLLHGTYTYDEVNFTMDDTGKTIPGVPDGKVKAVVEGEIVNRDVDIEKLKAKYGNSKLREAKIKLGLKGKAKDLDDKTWEKFTKELEKGDKKEKPEKKKEEKPKDRKVVIVELKKKYGKDKLREVKSGMEIKGKLDKVDEKVFNAFLKELEKEDKK